MIKSKEDYIFYLEEDRKSLKEKKGIIRFILNDIYFFQYVLRTLEYLENTKNKMSIKYIFYKLIFKRTSKKLGFSIPLNVFGPGLSIAHRGTIVVNHNARIGKNCRLHVCVNIGAQYNKNTSAPIIGDNCYIAPGVKMFGKIRLGNNILIGANAVVNKDFLENGVTIAGIPAKVINRT